MSIQVFMHNKDHGVFYAVTWTMEVFYPILRWWLFCFDFLPNVSKTWYPVGGLLVAFWLPVL